MRCRLKMSNASPFNWNTTLSVIWKSFNTLTSSALYIGPVIASVTRDDVAEGERRKGARLSWRSAPGGYWARPTRSLPVLIDKRRLRQRNSCIASAICAG